MGAKLQGKDITLEAAKDINLLAAANTSTNESHSLGGGVTLGVGQQNGISFQASASQANGTTKGSETTYDNSLVTATGKLTVKSGGDTNLVGAQLAGNKVKMDVGGDLNVVTLHDSSNFESKQSSSGFSVSVCVPPLCVGTTVTGSISKCDSSISLSYSGSSSGMSNLANNVTSTALASLASGNGMPANGSQSGTTQAVLSPGNVTITGTGDTNKDANSNTQVATLTGRDASKANGSLKNTLTLQQAQEIPAQQQRAAENAQAANLAGAAMDGIIGDISKANGWKPGSPQATILHGISGWAQAKIGGTNATTGLTSAVVNEQLVQPMSNYIATNCPTCVAKNPDGSTRSMSRATRC